MKSVALYPSALTVAMAASVCHGATLALPRESGLLDRWSFEYGVAFITSQNIEEILHGTVDLDSGPAGGEIHHFTASYLLTEPDWHLFGRSFQPALEAPLTLAVVNENGRSPFPDFSASFNVRWRDFPWNEWVHTSFAMGIGLSYAPQVYAMDIQRHPHDDRSRWKFNWPIQISLAHPNQPQHQIILFLAHQSGGKVFDRGGVNSLGFGYRFATW